MPVLLIATLDTKGNETLFVRDLLEGLGIAVTVVDAGVQPHAHMANVSAEEVFRLGGTNLAAVRKAGDRGLAITAAARGVTQLAVEHQKRGLVSGVFGLGGSAGTTIATAAMRAMPFGIPKVMVSTLASGQMRPYVGVRDIQMVNSVVDICGLNRINRTVLANAAAAMAGMVSFRKKELAGEAETPKSSNCFSAPSEKPLITATMFGVTTPCVEIARREVEAKGYEVLVFHATGTGGETMESFVSDGLVSGVLDLTTTELADELIGGILSAGPSRMTAAAMRGIPQVISLGALDMVNFGPLDTVPEKFKGRRLYSHNANVTLMRTTPEENDQLGKEIAHKASAAHGPSAVLIPLRGVSAIDKEGGPFWWPEADAALFDSLRLWMSPHIRLIELDLHINDPEFARSAAKTLLDMINPVTNKGSGLQ